MTSKRKHPSVIIFNAQLNIEKDEILEMAKVAHSSLILAALTAFGKMMWNIGRVFKEQKYSITRDYSVAKVRQIIKHCEAPTATDQEIECMSDVMTKALPTFFNSDDLDAGVISYAQCLLVGGWLYQTKLGRS
jgi:hypothetical protein